MLRVIEMPLTHKDLKKHVWLCTSVAGARDPGQLEEQGFNYLFVSPEGTLIAYKLVRLR